MIITAAFAFTPAKKSGDPVAGYYYTTPNGTPMGQPFLGVSDCDKLTNDICSAEFTVNGGQLVKKPGSEIYGQRP